MVEAAGSATAPPPSEKTAVPPTDSLNLPLPPVTLDFAIRGEGKGDGFLQRYVRKGDANDATAAVTGKGGFGTAYRFSRDDSFTPPNSLLDATVNSADHECSHTSDHHPRGEKLVRTLSHRSISHHSTPSQRAQAPGHPASVPPSPPKAFLGLQNRSLSGCRSKAPAVIVVKVCRTPTSGSYDELPKTGAGRTEAKVAAQELAAGNPIGEHTRIVRGEARLLRYLQICCTLEGIKSSQSHIVRLLADTPMPKPGSKGWMVGGRPEEEEEQYNGPPVPRLLVFERLVDLDAELTTKGWAKTKGVWSVEKVETVSRDAIAGLRFLHYHAIVHGDLKPSNFMRDARTGVVKLIDLGASRRWVRLHNMAKERTTAVEELDKAMQNGQLLPQRSEDLLCEGLGSLTGSPHFMAPEVLLQAGRYLSEDGMARNVLDDYVGGSRSRLPNHPSVDFLIVAHRDFKRGWGIKADIWSWGCSVLSLLLRTIETSKRPSSNTVCAFDFSFESDVDALRPLWPLHHSNDSLPRFHQWARLYALRIMSVVEKGVQLPDYTCNLSTPYLKMVQASFTHQNSRPSAQSVLDYIDSHATAHVEYMSEVEMYSGERAPSRCHSTAPSFVSVSTAAMSLPDDPHNVDLTVSTNMVTQNPSANVDTRLHGSEQVPLTPGVDSSKHRAAPTPKSNNLSIREPSRHASPRVRGSVLDSQGAQAMPQSQQVIATRSSAMHRRTASRVSEHQAVNSQRSSIVSTFREPGMEGQTGVSPSVSVLTAHTTAAAPEEKSRPKSALGRRQNGQGDVQTINLSSPRVAQTSGNLRDLYAASERQGANRTPDPESRGWKSRRGSIFSRVASTLAPRLYNRESSTNMQRNYAGGEMLSRAGLRNGEDSQAQAWKGVANNAHQERFTTGSPHMEYLSGAPSSFDHRQEEDSAQDVELTDASRSYKQQRMQRNSAHNMLGLELGNALQTPLRSARSFASLRSMNISSNSVRESQRLPIGQLAGHAASMHADHGRWAPADHLASPTSSFHRNVGVARSSAETGDENGGKGSAARPMFRDSGRSMGGVSVSSFAVEEANRTAAMKASAGSQKAHDFLQYDPYASEARTTQTSGTPQAPTRQRSWSSLLFRRSKTKA